MDIKDFIRTLDKSDSETEIIHVPLYHRDVAICGNEYDLPLFEISTSEWPSAEGTCVARTFNNTETGTTVMMFRDEYPSWGVIAHECLHTMNFILNRAGHTPDRLKDEPDAYLLEFLVEAVGQALSNIRDKRFERQLKKIKGEGAGEDAGDGDDA